MAKIFHMRDQEVFKTFTDVVVGGEGDNATTLENFEKITFSLQPPEGTEEDFDFDVFITKEYLGAESTKVEVKGVATLKDGTEVPFTAPVPLVKLQYELGSEENAQYKFDALKFFEKEWTFKTGDISGEGLTPEASKEIASAIDTNIDNFKTKFEKGGKKDGSMIYIENFPMDTVIPMAALYYVVQFSETFEIQEDKYITLGFDLNHYKMLTEKQNNMLKPIEQAFYNSQNSEGNDALFQFSIDDNLFNSVSSVFTSVDKTFSAREMMKSNPKLSPMLATMKTNVIGTLIPTFTEEYGDNKNFDIMFSPSHSLFKDGFPNAKMSGVYIDKNGNWKFQANIFLNLNVETIPKQWEPAREVYITMVFKCKLGSNGTNPWNKKFSLTPKNIEITNLKVLKDGQEQEMEQMMIQSVMNIQMENLKRNFKEIPFLLKTLL